MSQSLSKLWIHLVFSTRNRLPLLGIQEAREKMYVYLTGICRNLKCYPEIINGTEDHVHLLICLSKDISISTLVEQLKKSSSKWVKTQEGDDFLKRFYWQKGYGAFSVSESNVDSVKKYIKNQMHHHAKMTFQDEYQQLLQRNKVTYDEQYLWD